LNKMVSDQENNLEDNITEKEVCSGHLIKYLIKYKVVCDDCEKNDFNKYCPYYMPIKVKNGAS